MVWPVLTMADQPPLLQGLMVPIAFGALWMITGVSGLGLSAAGQLAWCLPAMGLAVGVYVAVRRLIIGRPARHRTVVANSWRWFNLVNAGQAVLIVIAIFGLAKAGLAGLIPAAVCLVVGLHFLPLAKVFDVPWFYLTGGLLVAVAAAGATVYASGAGTPPSQALVGLGAAAALWGSALATAARG
jgi:hypothetical protein